MMAVSLVLTPVSDPCNYETPSTTTGASDNPAGILKTAQNLKTYWNYLLSQFLENCTKPQNLNILKLSFNIYRSSASFLKTAQTLKFELNETILRQLS